MNQRVKQDILDILAQAIKIFEIKDVIDVIQLKELSNYTIHDATIFQDEDSVSIAILIYALAKIIERDINYKPILDLLLKAKKELKLDNIKNYRRTIKHLFELISDMDKKFKLYIQEVINKAQIKKGSKLYEHGISIAQTAYILGISQWELLEYIGNTTITMNPLNIRKRLEFTRRLFS